MKSDKFLLFALIVVTLQHRGDFSCQIEDQTIHLCRQSDSLSRQQFNLHRHVFVPEIMHIADIRRNWILGLHLFKKMAYCRRSSCSWKTSDENIIPSVFEVKPHTYRHQRSVLTNNIVTRFYTRCSFKLERVLRTPPSQFIYRNCFDFWSITH